MKMNHLFASAAVAAVVIGTAPAHAQILGGGVRGGGIGMQRATLSGGGFGHGAASEQATAGGSGHAKGRVDGIQRAEKPANSLARDGVHEGERANAQAEATGHGAAEGGASNTARVDRAAQGTVRDAAAYTSATAGGEGAARAGAANSSGGFAAGASGRDGPVTKPDTSARTARLDRPTASTKQSDTSSATIQPPPAKAPGSLSESSAEGAVAAQGSSETAGTSAGAGASTSVEASAKP